MEFNVLIISVLLLISLISLIFVFLKGGRFSFKKKTISEKGDILEKLYLKLKSDSAQLQESHQQLEAILESILDGIVVINKNRQITLFNKAMSNLTGLAVESVLGGDIDQTLALFDMENKITSPDFYPNEIEGKSFSFSKERLRIEITEKEALFTTFTAAVIFDNSGRNLGCVLSFHDHSEEQRLEEMRSDFVSTASHELRTPITAITGYLYLLLNKESSNFSEKQKGFLRSAYDSTKRLTNLTDNLILVATLDEATLKLNFQPVEWKSCLDKAIESLKIAAEEKNISLKLLFPNRVVVVNVDKEKINLVLTALIKNAISYSKENSEVLIKVEQDSNFITTSVTDTGKGIEKSALPHLFTKFYRVGGALEDYMQGTGLGLFIAKAIVEKHQGKINVDSIKGKGTTFSFTLPSAKTPN